MKGESSLVAGVGALNCKAKNVEIVKDHIFRDHVHIFVSVPPHISVSDLLKAVKGRTSRKILMEFKTLNRQFWGRYFGPGATLQPVRPM